MSSREHALFWSSMSYVILSRVALDRLCATVVAKFEGTDESQHPGKRAFARTFSFFHRLLWGLGMTYLCSVEFARLYCGGETIVAHFLRKFARFLTNHEKYSLAGRVMTLVVSWNELWLGRKSPSNLPAYKQAAVINALAGNSWWEFVKKLSQTRLRVRSIRMPQ